MSNLLPEVYHPSLEEQLSGENDMSTYASLDVYTGVYNEVDTREEAVRDAHRLIEEKHRDADYEIRVVEVLDVWSSDDLLPGE